MLQRQTSQTSVQHSSRTISAEHFSADTDSGTTEMNATASFEWWCWDPDKWERVAVEKSEHPSEADFLPESQLRLTLPSLSHVGFCVEKGEN